MLKRPLHKRFSVAVREGRKTTTIRNTPWPVGVPIMLYNWSASPYRSPQHDVAAVVVAKTSPITIEHLPSGQLLYTYDGLREGAALWWTEGFEDGHDIDDWFSPLVKRGKTYEGHLMTFSLANDKDQATDGARDENQPKKSK